MRSVATDGVAWPVGLSVTPVTPAKAAEPNMMPLWILTRVGPSNHVSGAGPQLPMQRGNFEGMTLGFSDTPPSTVPNGADVGIAPHAVD